MRKLAVLLAVVALGVACDHRTTTPPGGINDTIVVVGDSADLFTAFSQALQCSDLTWSVQEGTSAGTVSATGVFTAPACGSPYVGSIVHVVANGCGKTGVGAVSIAEDLNDVAITHAILVTGASSCLLPSPTNITVAPGATVQFYARLRFTCHDVYNPALPSPLPAACP